MEAFWVEEDVVFLVVLLQHLRCLGRGFLGQAGKVKDATVVERQFDL